MNAKKLVCAMFSVVVAGSLLLSGCGQEQTQGDTKKAEGAKFNFRLADNHPPDYPTVMGDKKFAELVYERTNGRIKIEVYPSGQLGDEKRVIEQVQLGAIEFTRVNAAPLAEFNKQFGALSLPYIFDSEQHLWKFLQEDMGTKMLDGLAKSKMKGLAFYDSGSRSFYARKPINSIADLKGMRIRVQQNKINMNMISAFGASAMPMAYGEVYSALQTGVIDAAENNYPSFYSSNHYQVAKYCILDSHQRTPDVLLMSNAIWSKLSEEDQKIVKQAALDSSVYQREVWGKYQKESEEKLRTAGVTIVDVKDVKSWRDAVETMLEGYRADYQDVLDAVEQARK